jgi:hypothetical protein
MKLRGVQTARSESGAEAGVPPREAPFPSTASVCVMAVNSGVRRNGNGGGEREINDSAY